MEFWLDRGVAGFRFHAAGRLYENASFTDQPLSTNRENWPHYYSLVPTQITDMPESIETVIEWRTFMDGYAKRKNTFPR